MISALAERRYSKLYQYPTGTELDGGGVRRYSSPAFTTKSGDLIYGNDSSTQSRHYPRAAQGEG
jgi:hypothetical protein